MNAQAVERDHPRDLLKLVGHFRGRLGLELLLLFCIRALSWALLVVAFLYVLAWLSQWEMPPIIAGSLIGGAMLMALALAIAQWPSLDDAARIADRRLILDERLSTAIESIESGSTIRVSPLQVADALESGTQARPGWPSTTPRIRRELTALLAIGCLAIGGLLLVLIGDDLPVSRQTILDALDPFQPGRSEPEATLPEPPPLPRADAPVPPNSRVASLIRSVEQLRQAGESRAMSPDEAAAGLAQAEASLQQSARESQAVRDELNRLARALNQVSAGRPAAESIERGDYQRAGAQLSELGEEADQLSQTAKEQLARALRSAASETPRNRLLAERERRAAEALGGRDYSVQRRMLRELGEEVARAGSGVIPQSDLAQGMSRIQEAQRELGQAPGQPLPGSLEGERSPIAQPPSSGATPLGDGQIQPGPDGAGFGTEEGDGPANAAGSPAAGTAPGGDGAGEGQQNRAPRLDVAGKPVEVPVKVGRGPANQPATGPSDPDSAEESNAAFGGSGPGERQVPAHIAAEQNSVPSDRRQVVRDYFSGDRSR